MKGAIRIAVVALILCVFTLGCDEDEKPVYHWKVFRENSDGNYTMWSMPKKPKMENGFACWDLDDGTSICISGKLTIESYQVGGE